MTDHKNSIQLNRGGRMRIGVWNIECVRAEKLNAKRLEFLHQRDADIWVLTETCPDIDLSDSHTHAAKSADRVRSRSNMHWVSIWSRFPVIESIPVEDVRTACAVLDAPLGQLLVYGTVWPWMGDTGEHPGDPVWKGWARQAAVIAHQKSHWTELRRARPKAAFCVAGDLNMYFGGPVLHPYKPARMEAAFAMDAHDLVCASAWDRVAGRSLERSPIDHVLLPFDWATRSRVVDFWPAQPGKDRLSDHSGLIVEVDTDSACSAP